MARVELLQDRDESRGGLHLDAVGSAKDSFTNSADIELNAAEEPLNGFAEGRNHSVERHVSNLQVFIYITFLRLTCFHPHPCSRNDPSTSRSLAAHPGLSQGALLSATDAVNEDIRLVCCISHIPCYASNAF